MVYYAPRIHINSEYVGRSLNPVEMDRNMDDQRVSRQEPELRPGRWQLAANQSMPHRTDRVINGMRDVLLTEVAAVLIRLSDRWYCHLVHPSFTFPLMDSAYATKLVSTYTSEGWTPT